jgi:hypothetical protein
MDNLFVYAFHAHSKAKNVLVLIRVALIKPLSKIYAKVVASPTPERRYTYWGTTLGELYEIFLFYGEFL